MVVMLTTSLLIELVVSSWWSKLMLVLVLILLVATPRKVRVVSPIGVVRVAKTLVVSVVVSYSSWCIAHKIYIF